MDDDPFVAPVRERLREDDPVRFALDPVERDRFDVAEPPRAFRDESSQRPPRAASLSVGTPVVGRPSSRRFT
ncbi:hypothetical protein [Halogeometricum sp. CBA1124]|uniref:hypothetical protein n=1 Tax=Halogeometricum sp. CBA1124 TaxID=2668071 RepID=UPI001E48C23A|nr:hypothetical protein [Halogeometricum sp. CBA1124]